MSHFILDRVSPFYKALSELLTLHNKVEQFVVWRSSDIGTSKHLDSFSSMRVQAKGLAATQSLTEIKLDEDQNTTWQLINARLLAKWVFWYQGSCGCLILALSMEIPISKPLLQQNSSVSLWYLQAESGLEWNLFVVMFESKHQIKFCFLYALCVPLKQFYTVLFFFAPIFWLWPIT